MATTLEQWRKARGRTVSLPSGAKVAIALPSVPQMIRAGRVPNPLIEIAVRYEAQGLDLGEKITTEQLLAWTDFTRLLVSEMLLDPVVAAEELDSIPAEDFEQLSRWAFRAERLPGPRENEVEEVGDLAPFPAGRPAP